MKQRARTRRTPRVPILRHLFDVRATPSRGSWDFANYCKAIENEGIFSISDSELRSLPAIRPTRARGVRFLELRRVGARSVQHARGMSKTETEPPRRSRR